MRKVPVSPRIIGKFAARNVYASRGTYPLVRKGAKVQPAVVDALLRRGIKAIWITDEVFPEFEVREIVRDETREVVHNSLAEIFSQARSLGAERKSGRPRPESRLAESVRMLVDEVAKNDDVVVNIGRVRAWDNYTFEHSVQVATLSVVIGKRMMMTEDQLVRLGTGAILHDVGKVMVPQEILLKPDKLTAQEYEIVKTHARAGWDIVHEGFQNIMPTSSIVVLQHHERLDGSGYPQGLKGDDIYLFSKITAVADVLDAVRASRNYRSDFSPSQILHIMQHDAGIRLDASAVHIALSHVALIAEGEIVRLSNGLLGMVTGINAGHPLQPLVTVVADDCDTPLPREEMDLRGTDLQVTEMLDEWPPGVGNGLQRERAQKPKEMRGKEIDLE